MVANSLVARFRFIALTLKPTARGSFPGNLSHKLTNNEHLQKSAESRFDGCAASISSRQSVGKGLDPWRARFSEDGVDPSRVG